MFVKVRHLKALIDLREGKEVDSETLLELRILNFVDRIDGRIRLTKAGSKMLGVALKLKLDVIPEVFVDTEIVKMLELMQKTGWIPEEWTKVLEERDLVEDGRITDVGRTVLDVYRTTHPNLLVTKELLDFVAGMPKMGTFEELVAYRERIGYGENVINALQAMRILLISPKTQGKAFSTTETHEYLLNMARIIKRLDRPIFVRGKEFRALRQDMESDELEEMGLRDEGGVTDLGKVVADAYESLGVRENPVYPIYVTGEELRILEVIAKIEEIHSNSSDVLPTYSEIRERSGLGNTGELLHILESKDFVRREVVKGKETYWLTEWGGSVIGYGEVSIDGMKALTFPKAGDVPIYEWVVRAKEEELVKMGITQKGKFMLKLTESVERKPYLTKFDVAILAKTPRRGYVLKDELVEMVREYAGEGEIERAIGEAESKGYVVELQNRTVKLTPLGRMMKDVVEYAKTKELMNVAFAVTPTTFEVLKAVVENIDFFDRLWKEKKEERNYRTDEIEFIRSRVKMSEGEIEKSLKLLRAVGLLGKKSVTKAGKILVRAYSKAVLRT